MQYNINGKEYNYITDIKENEKVRHSFNELSEKTFGINFEPWYQAGYWGNQYIPHVLIDENRVVANISVNIIDMLWENQVKRYIQLGTVMTDSEYRGMGLSRWLMEKILEEYKKSCDGIYLFANDSVLDFYPKFGFVKRDEYQYEMSIVSKVGEMRALNMSIEEDRRLLLEKYKQSNPFSALQMEGNIGLLMFYCSQFMKDSVYYIEKYDAVVVMEQDGGTMFCYDIFSHSKDNLRDILEIAAHPQTTNVVFGFTPKSRDSYKNSLLKGEDTLFVLGELETIFEQNKLMFPLLSHA